MKRERSSSPEGQRNQAEGKSENNDRAPIAEEGKQPGPKNRRVGAAEYARSSQLQVQANHVAAEKKTEDGDEKNERLDAWHSETHSHFLSFLPDPLAKLTASFLPARFRGIVHSKQKGSFQSDYKTSSMQYTSVPGRFISFADNRLMLWTPNNTQQFWLQLERQAQLNFENSIRYRLWLDSSRIVLVFRYYACIVDVDSFELQHRLDIVDPDEYDVKSGDSLSSATALNDGGVAFACTKGSVRIWRLDGDTWRFSCDFHVYRTIDRVYHLENGAFLVTFDNGAALIGSKFNPIKQLQINDYRSVAKIGQNRVAFSYRDETIDIYSAVDGRLLRSLVRTIDPDVLSPCSDLRNLVAVCSESSTKLLVLDPDTGEALHAFKTRYSIDTVRVMGGRLHVWCTADAEDEDGYPVLKFQHLIFE